MDDSIARIDAHRARQAAAMLVTDYAPAYEPPPDVLVDISKFDGVTLFKTGQDRGKRYGTTPFDPQGDLIRLYPGGVTVWSGFPGAGKTTLLRQFVCHTLSRGSAVFLASLEEEPVDVMLRLCATAAGQREASAHQIQWFIDAYAKRFRLWGRIGIAQHIQLIGVIRKLAAEGIRHAVIDSLMCLDVANDDLEAQRRFANLLSATARASQIHIHLVAHPRKLINSAQEPDLNDIAGAREIGGIADNVIFIRRGTEGNGPDSASPSMKVLIRKQRHFDGSLGEVEGVFMRDHKQFATGYAAHPTRYLPDNAYEGIA